MAIDSVSCLVSCVGVAIEGYHLKEGVSTYIDTKALRGSLSVVSVYEGETRFTFTITCLRVCSLITSDELIVIINYYY